MRTLLFVLLALPLLAASCGGGDMPATAQCANRYWDGVVGVCLPAGWHVVDRAALDVRGASDDVHVAFQADAPSAGQYPTVTVTREQLTRTMESAEYSAQSVTSLQTLPGYEKGSTRDLTIDDAAVQLITFIAKPKEEQPKARFIQVSIASGTQGYSFTAAAPVSAQGTILEQMTAIIESATLREK